ncbi:MAG: 50S ribosomal protein L39e [uncultured DHVE6 group euryarchaeote]|jgi:ribosomal protein L39E|nr:MAG: 50S ribosomal protein L39e [uncultured DHVE6 group euryarchaeote]
MSSRKPSGRKNRLITAGRQTRWAPFWIIPKKFGVGKRVHPSAATSKKRRWRKGNIQRG